jgi:hypothetical protein
MYKTMTEYTHIYINTQAMVYDTGPNVVDWKLIVSKIFKNE